MKDVHVTPELLRAIHESELPGEVMFRLIWEHFQALCPTCKAAIEEWQAETRGGDYDSAFENAKKKAEEKVRDVETLKRAIDREVREILRLDPEEAVERIKGASKRFRSPLLVDRLLDEAAEQLHGDPRRAVELLRCARAIVERPEKPLSPELRVRVILNHANALRVARKHREADIVFQEVRDLMRTEPVISFDLYALRASFEGSQRRDQSNFEQAKKLLSQSILIYRVVGDENEAAKVLLSLSYVHFRLGETVQSLEAIHEALNILDPEEDLSLSAIARQNLASYLCDTGDPRGARHVLHESHAVLARYIEEFEAETSRLAIIWLEGRIARDLEEYERAEEKLVAAAEGFSDLDIGYDTALVLLDLADSYLASGEAEAVRRLVPEIEPLLSASDLNHEVVAALLLFQNAIAQDLVSKSTVALVRKKIQGIGRAPGRDGAN